MRRRGGPPWLWLFSDPLRLPDPLAAAARLPRGAGVVARGVDPEVLAALAVLARRRGLALVVAGDGRAGLALGGGVHVPDRRPTRHLLPLLLARRAGAPGAWLTMAAHGGAGAAARARRLRPDLVFLSPIFPTASHPGAPALGPLRWAAAAGRLGGVATGRAKGVATGRARMNETGRAKGVATGRAGMNETGRAGMSETGRAGMNETGRATMDATGRAASPMAGGAAFCRRTVLVAALGGIAPATLRRLPRRAAAVGAIGGLLPQAVARPPQCLR
ncbi:thiamine phosphate synthase [Roseomonas sp. CECT 9278]|uniref:thiamine phosphate synthase n=1 Tax=Roseomonas sp. CECT 9278 TaxID=2845823 RepID=UPI001E5FCCCA|nr:thiamine phosphate synthase [Roseomonas sp. CECT 9278]